MLSACTVVMCDNCLCLCMLLFVFLLVSQTEREREGRENENVCVLGEGGGEGARLCSLLWFTTAHLRQMCVYWCAAFSQCSCSLLWVYTWSSCTYMYVLVSVFSTARLAVGQRQFPPLQGGTQTLRWWGDPGQEVGQTDNRVRQGARDDCLENAKRADDVCLLC